MNEQPKNDGIKWKHAITINANEKQPLLVHSIVDFVVVKFKTRINDLATGTHTQNMNQSILMVLAFKSKTDLWSMDDNDVVDRDHDVKSLFRFVFCKWHSRLVSSRCELISDGLANRFGTM